MPAMTDETKEERTEADDLQEELAKVINSHPNLTCFQIVGTLEYLKAEFIERTPRNAK